MAQYADMIFCLVRTSQEEIPQKGISFFLIDMHSPGITVQPIVTLDKAPEGDQEINTVFFENVKVNDENELIKKNRLELLNLLCKSFDNFFNFSKIEG